MAYIAFVICFIVGIAGVVILGIYNHPWLAIFCLLVVGSLSANNDKDSDDNSTDDAANVEL